MQRPAGGLYAGNKGTAHTRRAGARPAARTRRGGTDGLSYEYSRKFKAFKAEMNRKEKLGGQMEMEEFL